MTSTDNLPFVSVCIPARNGEACLGHSLSNLLLHASYPRDRFEVLVGNHGSTDGTSATIAAWARRCSNVRSVDVPFTAPCRAAVRNAILREARGELLVFLDHDVLVPDDFLAAHVRAHQASPGSLVAGTILGTRCDPALRQELASVDWDHVSTGEAFLRAHPALADPRLSCIPGIDLVDLLDVTQHCGSFRWFWGGNVSVARADLEAAGTFDERYQGWGLEDGDFAQQLRRAGRKLVFARSIWGFHVPIASDGWSKLAEWRDNFERFFRKFPTREVESYGLHGPELIDAGIRKLEDQARILGRIDVHAALEEVADVLPSPAGRRLAHFIPDATAAHKLLLTDALRPFGPRTTEPYVDAGIQFWSLMGMKLPFSRGELDEAVVLTDVAMWLDPFLLKLLLCEVARCTKLVLFCSSREARGRARGLPFRALQDTAAEVRFERAVWLSP